jgi:hypothetical protein
MLAGLAPLPTAIVFYAVSLSTVLTGLFTWRSGRGNLVLAAGSVATFVTGIAGLIAFFCLYYYEIPTHHCPFCLLQSEYGRIGFLLYGLMITGVITGSGCGLLERYKNIQALVEIVPAMQRRLAMLTSLTFTLYLFLVTLQLLTSTFKLS